MRRILLTAAAILTAAFVIADVFNEKSGVTFDNDKATLKPESFIVLDQVGADIQKRYNEDNTMEVKISGHTDSNASNSYNMKLSQRRSDTVKKYFIEKFGIPETNIEAAGYGEEVPIADNATPEGRATNRRVEIEYAGLKLVLSSAAAPTVETPVFTPAEEPTPSVTPTATVLIEDTPVFSERNCQQL